MARKKDVQGTNPSSAKESYTAMSENC